MKLIPTQECRKLVIILFLLLVVCPAAWGGTGNENGDKMSAGEAMVAGGIDKGIIRMADGMMEFVCGDGSYTGTSTPPENPHKTFSNQNTSSSCHGESAFTNVSADESLLKNSVTRKIIGFASWSVKPFSYPTIWGMMGLSLAGAFGFLVTYTFLGAANTAIAAADATKYATMKSILGSETSNNSFENYGQNVLAGTLGMVFSVLLIYLTLLFAKALKLMMLNTIADSISPSLASVSVLYLMMAFMWVCVSLFFGISNIVICLTAGFSFLIGALYASDRTRHISTWYADYFLTMVAMQVFVVAITTCVVGVIMDIKTGKHGGIIYAYPGAEASMYIGLTIILVYMCYRLVFGKTLLLRSGAKLIKLVI